VNISHMRTLVTVVEQGSFSAAAKVMGVSQPAVTMQVQTLEADLGVTLFDRKYRKLELTEAGEALLPFARSVLAEVDNARSEIERLSKTVTGRLIVAASTAPGQYMLPKILGGFLREYPQVGVVIQIADTTQVVEAVASGQAHLGITGAKVAGTKVVYERMGSDDLIVICPKDDALATGPVELSALAEAPFIMRESGSGTRLATEKILREASIDTAELHVVTELGTSEAIVSAVEGGLGVAVVSRLVAEKALALGTIAEVSTSGFPATRPLFAVLPRGTRTRAAEAFLGHLQSTQA